MSPRFIYRRTYALFDPTPQRSDGGPSPLGRQCLLNRREDAPPVIIPTELVEDEKVLTLGGREIRILFLGRAHTGGDLHVYLPEEKILFMSEAYLNRIFPALRSAYPSEWVEMIAIAQAMDVDVYVPGCPPTAEALLYGILQLQDKIRRTNTIARS